MAKAVYLTTVDNPWSPFDNFDEWYVFDVSNGYDCLGQTERVANLTDDMTSKEQDICWEEAINTIIKDDPTGIYTSVEIEDDEEPIAID